MRGGQSWLVVAGSGGASFSRLERVCQWMANWNCSPGIQQQHLMVNCSLGCYC